MLFLRVVWYVYVYTCTCACECVSVRVCVSVDVRVYVCEYVCVGKVLPSRRVRYDDGYTCICVCLYMYVYLSTAVQCFHRGSCGMIMYADVYVYVCMCMCVHVCVCVYSDRVLPPRLV